MIVGLVAHLCREENLAQSALNAIARRGWDLGQRINHRVPVVIDSPHNLVEDCTLWLQSLSGVLHVDVIFVHFDDAYQVDATECPRV